jgi:hypothetical protein
MQPVPDHMITTAFTLPGYRVVRNLGVVRGLTVRSRSLVSADPEGYLAAPASASSFFSSPLLYISSAMSQPPSSSPLTYSCG